VSPQVGDGKETVLTCVKACTKRNALQLYAYCMSEKARLDARIVILENTANKNHPIWKRKTIIHVLPDTVKMRFYDMVSEANIKKKFCSEWDFTPNPEEEYDTDDFSSVYGDSKADKLLGKNLLRF
jgi:hypothetical protein